MFKIIFATKLLGKLEIVCNDFDGLMLRCHITKVSTSQ